MQAYWRNSVLFACLMMFGVHDAKVDAYYYKTYSPSSWRNCGNWLEVEMDFLFWKPCIDRLDVAAIVLNNQTHTDVRNKKLCPDWQSGYAFSFFLPDLFYCWDVSLGYWHLKSDDSMHQRASFKGKRKIVSSLLYNGQHGWNYGKERLELCYGELELLFHRDLLRKKCERFAPYVGLAGLYVDQDLEAKFSKKNTPAEVEAEWISRYAGVGIRAGGDYERQFLSCLKYFANGSLTLLTGETTATFLQISQDSGEKELSVEVPDGNDCHCVLGYHVRTGAALERCICGWDYAIRLGYEFVGWHNLSNQRTFFATNNPATAAASTSAQIRTLGYHGLFAGVSIRF